MNTTEARLPVILTIDDEPEIRFSIKSFLEDYYYQVLEAPDGAKGLEIFHQFHPDVIIVDLRMPNIDGLAVLAEVKKQSPNTPVIVASGTGHISDVVQALQLGAWNFLLKPLEDMNVLRHSVARAVERVRLLEENQRYQKGLEQKIEELKSAQKRLVESEKMASLGTLVAGVAHEINTPVGIGVTAASYLQETVTQFERLYADEKASHEDLNDFLENISQSSKMILSNLQRASQLIRSFKQVAVDQSSEKSRQFNLKEYIEEVFISLHPKFHNTKHTYTIECPNDININSYPGALSQILTNFVINSLVHGFENVETGIIAVDVSRKNQFITIRYRDNGVGMSESALSKVFDPFYTTKRSSGGTGLGMHMVYNLVTQTLGGKIECTSTLGEGTGFEIVIPGT